MRTSQYKVNVLASCTRQFTSVSSNLDQFGSHTHAEFEICGFHTKEAQESYFIKPIIHHLDFCPIKLNTSHQFIYDSVRTDFGRDYFLIYKRLIFL